MSFTRRTFLVGTASGLSVLVLAACTDGAPLPTPTPEPTNGVDRVPLPETFYRTSWATDPYSRGATTLNAVGDATSGRMVLQEAVLGRVFFAGDAISEDPGTVRGAIASGRSAARRLLATMADGERVAVVGAGAAGAAAARTLTAGGAEVVVVEARDRSGGRVDSRVAADDFFELGAWRLTVADAEIIEGLANRGIEVAPLNRGSAFAVSGDETLAEIAGDDPALEAVSQARDEALAWAVAQPRDVSVARAFEQGTDPATWPASKTVSGAMLADELLLQVAASTGADADALSAWFSAFDPSDDQVVPVGALSTFIDGLLDGIDVALSSAVVGVSYDSGGVSLRLGAGESLAVDRVVLTVPAGVLQEQVIEFDPVLPLSHRAALNELSIGHIELIRLEYDTAFWDTPAVWWILEDENEPIRTWVNLLPATGRPALLGIVAGQHALDLAELDDAELTLVVRRGLLPFVPTD